MIPDGYRIHLQYNTTKECFIATVPELGAIVAEAPTRSEALVAAEEQIEAAFRKAAEDGKEMPKPIETIDFSGELALSITPGHHRELAFLAAEEGVEVEKLAAEMIVLSMGMRAGHKRRDRDSGGGDQQGKGGRRKGGRQRKDYHAIMDDRASFIEYVRGMEAGKGGGGGGGGAARGRGRGRGRSGGGGGGRK